ncbi:GDP-mannose 4,6-dehydratase, partial [bacterium]|nr:GDP-mannose 4,6-dehydratase [bacterium]
DVSKKFCRGAEADYLKDDYSKDKETLGWEPEVTFEDMIKRMVEHDIGILKNK